MMQEFVQQITNTVRENMNGIHTAIPGIITAFDPASCIASVLPSMKFKKPDGKSVAYPQITGVPVVFPQAMGQQATIAFPVKAGDGCLIVVAEQSIDMWLYGQETNTDLAFDLTNSICIPGLFAKGNPVVQDACGENAVIVDVKGTRLKIKSGEITIDAAQVTINGNLKINGEGEATGDVKANSGVSLATHKHTGDSGGMTSSPIQDSR